MNHNHEPGFPWGLLVILIAGIILLTACGGGGGDPECEANSGDGNIPERETAQWREKCEAGL